MFVAGAGLIDPEIDAIGLLGVPHDHDQRHAAQYTMLRCKVQGHGGMFADNLAHQLGKPAARTGAAHYARAQGLEARGLRRGA